MLATLPSSRPSIFGQLADRLDPDTVVGEQERLRAAAAADVRQFARHVKILDSSAGEESFKPWGWQLELLRIWMVTRLVIILKARQLGVSWCVAIFALWTAMFGRGQKVLLISKDQAASDELLAKVTFVFNSLPDWMKPVAKPLTRSLSFPGLNSSIEALPATEGVGRSHTATLVVLDEHAHQRWARKIFLALKPTVETGKLLSISTANGLGALHTKLYLDAKAKLNGFVAVFIPYTARPGRNAAWLEQERATLSALSDAEFNQEYPATDNAAFIATGRPVFRNEDIERQPVEAGVAGKTGLTLYREPEAGKIYIIGADVSEGLERSDWCSASVIERDSGEQVAQLRGRWAPDVYASRLDELARHYAAKADAKNRQPVIVAVERNNHGHAAILRLVQLHAGAAPYAIFRAKDNRLGWLTSTATRPVLVDQLEAALRLGEVTLHDAGTVDQFQTFSWNDDGKPEAQEGFFDDDVLSMGIGWQVRRRSFGRVLGLPQRPAKAAA